LTSSCTEQVEISYPTADDLPVKYQATLKHAMSGNDTAQVDIAFAYIDGDGVSIDTEKAIEWLKIAASQNNDEAQFNLGVLYFNAAKKSKGQPYFKEAFRWSLLQAKNDNKEAQYNVAIMYEDGLGVKKDAKKAFFWYLQSAVNGHPVSQRNVGSSYSSGFGVKIDEKKAFEWFKKSAENGDEDSMFFTGRFFGEGKVTTKDLVKAYQWMKLSLFIADQSGSDNDVVDNRKAEFEKLKSIMSNKDIEQAEIWYKRKTS